MVTDVAHRYLLHMDKLQYIPDRLVLNTVQTSSYLRFNRIIFIPSLRHYRQTAATMTFS